MFELFLKYIKATNNKRSMSREDQKKSGLTFDEFIFIYDHFDEIKKEYAVLVAMTIACNDILNKCDLSNQYLRKAKSIRYRMLKYIDEEMEWIIYDSKTKR